MTEALAPVNLPKKKGADGKARADSKVRKLPRAQRMALARRSAKQLGDELAEDGS